MIVCGTTENSLCERLLRECDLTLFKAIIAGHAGEETRKHVRKILRAQSTANIDKIFKRKPTQLSHNTHNHITRGFIKNVNFAIVHIPKANYGKVCYVCNKNKHFKARFQRIGKKVHKIEKDESDEPSHQSEYELFTETINIKLRIY